MKKTIISVALVAVLGSMAVSCQKEDVIYPTSIVAESNIIYIVRCSIDGETNTISLVGEDAWNEFLDYMFALAEEGHEVSFRNEKESLQNDYAKETVTYTTTDKNKAYEWAENKSKEGYKVTIFFDKDNGSYTCIAIR